MRPIRLTVRAFGPYADVQAFDFTELGDRSFLLICGPTGSGKTSLLDALCFALFGDTSGAERSGKQMRSDYADPATPTEVTLDFSIGPEVYRVTRSPEQPRPKKRGDGLTVQPPTATLWRRTSVAAADAEGSVVASRWGDVTAAVERALGFHSDQFRQVVMLPQGQFRRLLTAGSDDRERILERLFRTEVYRRIEEALKVSARQIRNEHEQARQRRDVILEQAGITSLQELVQRRARREVRAGTTRARVARLRAEARQAHERLSEGRQTRDKFRELEAADAALKALEGKKAQITLVRRTLGQARKAAAVIDAEVTLQTGLKEVEEARTKLQNERHTLATAEQAHEAARKALATAESRAEERERATRDRNRLDELTSKVKQLSNLRLQLAEAQAEVERLRALREEAKARAEDLRQQIEAGQERSSQAQNLAAQLEGRRAAADAAQRRLLDRTRLTDLRVKLAAARKQHEEKRGSTASVEAALSRTRAELAALEATWNAGQAAILAQRLADGQPCPVCGSTEHPAPARAAGHLPTEQDLEDRRAAVDRLLKKHEAARTTEGQARDAVVSLEADERALIEGLGTGAEADPTALEADSTEKTRAVAAAESAGASVSKLTEELARLKSERSRSETAREETEKKLADATARAAEHTGRVDAAVRDVPEGLRELPALQTAQKQAREKVRLLETELNAARESAGRSSESLAAANTAVASADADLASRQTRAEELRAAFDRRLREAGFESEAEYSRARRRDEEITLLENEIKAYEADRAAAFDRLERARAATADLALPDLATLEARDAKCQRVADRAVHRSASLDQAVQDDRQACAALERIAADVERLEARYAIHGRLADVANGQNRSRINLQRYVLAALLDDVLIAATARLKVMSKARFHLHRARESSDRRVAAGLDLEVYDSYTGTARPVATLSGGEGFMAALALALGLADVVQSYAGGIHLETIFVDEGFGSLDPEALDLAIQTLLDLRHGGRLVGIISHVPDLRERIDTRLEITPGRLGSSARFVVG